MAYFVLWVIFLSMEGSVTGCKQRVSCQCTTFIQLFKKVSSFSFTTFEGCHILTAIPKAHSKNPQISDFYSKADQMLQLTRLILL